MCWYLLSLVFRDFWVVVFQSTRSPLTVSESPRDLIPGATNPLFGGGAAADGSVHVTRLSTGMLGSTVPSTAYSPYGGGDYLPGGRFVLFTPQPLTSSAPTSSNAPESTPVSTSRSVNAVARVQRGRQRAAQELVSSLSRYGILAQVVDDLGIE